MLLISEMKIICGNMREEEYMIDIKFLRENPDIVKPAPFKEVKINKGTMKVKLPAKSIVTLELQ